MMNIGREPNEEADDAAPVIATYQSGERVSVLAEQGEWVEVRIGEGDLAQDGTVERNGERTRGKVQPREFTLDEIHPVQHRIRPVANLDTLQVERPFKPPLLEQFGELVRHGSAEFLGIHEDNDPSKRLVAIINYNNDIGDYWEFSDQGYFPVDLSNTAYKLGVNYVVYGMTR